MNHKKNVFRGVLTGLFMFLFMGIIYPLSQSEPLVTNETIKIALYWVAAGILYEYLTPFIFKKLNLK